MNLTNDGRAAVARKMAGEDLRISGVVVGNGGPQDPDTVTALNSPQLRLNIIQAAAEGNTVVITCGFRNTDVSSGFRATEIALLYMDGETEKIYAYMYTSPQDAEYFGPAREAVSETRIDFVTYIGDGGGNVSVNINGSITYATVDQLQDHKTDQDNPHHVTAAQVGLGAVPNVATNDQTPTWSSEDESGPYELTSGSALKNLFAKTAGAIRSAVAHIANRDIHINAGERDVWNGDHTHGTAAINEGVLGVERGGTGAGSWQTGGVLFAKTPTRISQVNPPAESGAALVMQGLTGDPIWCKTSRSGSYTGMGQTPNAPYYTRLIFPPEPINPKMMIIVEEESANFAVLMLDSGGYNSGFSCVRGVLSALQCELTSEGYNTLIRWKHLRDDEYAHPDEQMDKSGVRYYYTLIY